MQAKLIIALIIFALGSGLWWSIDAVATTRTELKQAKALSVGLVKQIGGMAEEHKKQLDSTEEAYRVRDSRKKQADDRSKAAEEKFKQGGSDAAAWAVTPVLPAVTDSLCLKPGSCTGEMPGATEATSRTDEAGTGDATERVLQLTNDALRTGIENCRADLGSANAQLIGLCSWCDGIHGVGECGCKEVTE